MVTKQQASSPSGITLGGTEVDAGPAPDLRKMAGFVWSCLWLTVSLSWPLSSPATSTALRQRCPICVCVWLKQQSIVNKQQRRTPRSDLGRVEKASIDPVQRAGPVNAQSQVASGMSEWD